MRGKEGLGMKAGFWEGHLGKLIRWLAFVPVGFVLIGLVEITSAASATWILSLKLWTFVLLLTCVPVLTIAAFFYFGAIMLATKTICPSRKAGAMVFAVVYSLWMTLWLLLFLVGISMGDYTARAIVGRLLFRGFFLFIAVSALRSVYTADQDDF